MCAPPLGLVPSLLKVEVPPALALTPHENKVLSCIKAEESCWSRVSHDSKWMCQPTPKSPSQTKGRQVEVSSHWKLPHSRCWVTALEVFEFGWDFLPPNSVFLFPALRLNEFSGNWKPTNSRFRFSLLIPTGSAKLIPIEVEITINRSQDNRDERWFDTLTLEMKAGFFDRIASRPAMNSEKTKMNVPGTFQSISLMKDPWLDAISMISFAILLMQIVPVTNNLDLLVVDRMIYSLYDHPSAWFWWTEDSQPRWDFSGGDHVHVNHALKPLLACIPVVTLVGLILALFHSWLNKIRYFDPSIQGKLTGGKKRNQK